MKTGSPSDNLLLFFEVREFEDLYGSISAQNDSEKLKVVAEPPVLSKIKSFLFEQKRSCCAGEVLQCFEFTI